MEIAFHEFPLIPTRFVFRLREVGAADAELGQHDVRRLGAVVLAVECPAALDHGQPHLPRPVGEHDHVGTELGGGIDRLLAGGHRVDAAVEGILRARAQFRARLLVERPVALDEAGPEGLDDHRRRLVEALARLVHAEAERGELAPRQAPPQAEAQAALAQHVEHGGILGDAERIVPRQDDGGGAQVDIGTERRQVGHQLKIVGHERVIVEMVLRRPEAVEAQIGGEPGQPDLLVPHAGVGAVVPAVAGEHHHHANVHSAFRPFEGLTRWDMPSPACRPHGPPRRPRPAPVCGIPAPPPRRSARETRGGRRCSA